MPGEVVVLDVPGAICDLMSPGDPCEFVEAPPPDVPGVWAGCAPLGGEAMVLPLAALPGDIWVLVVPGAICPFTSPGEP
ncbi:MAG TPA: hypothetical protein VEY69_06375 [Lautropia sp.]|nr:hypothetical protein [Lautropia sp.]